MNLNKLQALYLLEKILEELDLNTHEELYNTSTATNWKHQCEMNAACDCSRLVCQTKKLKLFSLSSTLSSQHQGKVNLWAMDKNYMILPWPVISTTSLNK